MALFCQENINRGEFIFLDELPPINTDIISLPIVGSSTHKVLSY